jgi:hypothetical protein
MTIDIKGHSGCDIDIIEIDGNLYVKKSTNDPKYLKRLYLQGNKQKNDIALCGSIVNPQIYELVQNDKEAYILMDYVYAKNFIDYFENASPEDINHFIDTFIKYINKELESCEIKSVDKKVFIDKFNSVKKNCENNKLTNDNKKVKLILDACEAKFNQLTDNINLPCNICHGDLTFSNILFTSNKYYFIDYLDSFIETPIQDIVKLRQDTKYFWSTMMYSKRYDIVRLNMIFSYIDNKINNYFSEYNEYYAQHYETLQIMNILRILPYVKKESVRDFVLNILSSFVGV